MTPLVRILFTSEGVRYAGLLALLTVLAGGSAFASVEGRSLGNGIYWAVVTMTTVGYGDFVPQTPEGKAITIAVMVVGIGFATLLIGAIAERFINRQPAHVDLTDDDILSEVRDISARLHRLEGALERRRCPG